MALSHGKVKEVRVATRIAITEIDAFIDINIVMVGQALGWWKCQLFKDLVVACHIIMA